MQSDNLTYAFVIDQDRQLVGYLTLDQILEAQKRGAATVDNVAKGDYPSATPETLVEELVGLAAEFECPIAVVSAEGELLGEIHRETLLNSLADSLPTQNGD
jgi:glycine betaine/proline transport system ATP-binding protein